MDRVSSLLLDDCNWFTEFMLMIDVLRALVSLPLLLFVMFSTINSFSFKHVKLVASIKFILKIVSFDN
jgi:hypothetical protein